MPSEYSKMYTLSDEAYEHLLELNIYHHDTRNAKSTSEWDGVTALQSTRIYDISPQTMKRQERYMPTRGLSATLNDIPHDVPIEEWIDTRPKHIKFNDVLIPTPEKPPEPIYSSTATTQTAKEYIHDYGAPDYRIPFFQKYKPIDEIEDETDEDEIDDYEEPKLIPVNRKRYKLALNPVTTDYFYRLALRFNMRPFHQGGRDLRTALVSVCLEAIGMEYISIREKIEEDENDN